MKSKKRINITVDKSVYKIMKQKNLKISTYINQMLKVALINNTNNIEHSNSLRSISGSNPGRGRFCKSSCLQFKVFLPQYLAWIDAQSYSVSHTKKLKSYGVKLSKNTHFFTYEELVKVKKLFSQDAYYKAARGIANYLKERYHDDSEILAEIEKINKRLSKKPQCVPDLYTPTDEELKQTLRYLSKSCNKYYCLYLGLLYSGIRIRELISICSEGNNYRVLDCGSYKKIVLNKKKGTKNAYIAYLPAWLELPKEVTAGALSRYLSKHKQVIRPKYMRNWFYKKCIELGIPAAIVDYYQGRSPISVGNKHYLEKEKLADRLYIKVIDINIK